MALIDITPVMTNYNTPVPYVVSASSYYPAREPYHAFDGVTNNIANSWATSNSGGTSGWIKLDFGNSVKCDAISITSRSRSGEVSPPDFVGTTEAPRNFNVYGSDVDSDESYMLILSKTGETSWTPEETRIYEFENQVKYRYYKISILSNNGYSGYVALGEIRFYEHKEERSASSRYTLPFGSKTRLDSLGSDLTYMLATEDDGNNEGTLRIVDKNGKFIRAKAEMVNADVLFDGIASTNGTIYNMTGKISDYKYLLVIGGVTNGTTNVETIMIPTNRIKSYSSTVEQFSIGVFSSSAYYYRVAISFVSESSFTRTNSSLSGWTSPVITNIYGIK